MRPPRHIARKGIRTAGVEPLRRARGIVRRAAVGHSAASAALFAFALSALALSTLALSTFAARASTPASFEQRAEALPPLTAEMAALDPLAAEARCRSFLTALYQRHQVLRSNPAWGGSGDHADPLAWALDAVFSLPPASADVRAATAAAGDLTRAYLDAFGPAAAPNSLPDDPLYRNDKIVCEGVLGLAHD